MQEEAEVGEFRNPEGFWRYTGAYTVFVTEGAHTGPDHLPRGAVFHGQTSTVFVAEGTVQPGPCGIQFRAKGQPFFLVSNHIREIRDADGELIWRSSTTSSAQAEA